MAGENERNDFVGFSFGNIHSSKLGIKRTSDGSRFNENLLPTIQDKTIQVPGGDGTYYFGSYYTQRPFTVPFAFDALTDEQFRKLKQWLGDKKIKDLIFDEAPYKVYRAKITGNATIKHICFDETDIVKDADSGEPKEITKRVYKGEGSITFTCYYPFAHSPKGKKFLSKYDNLNKDEWAATSGMLEEQGTYDKFNGNSAPLYNPGDLETDFTLILHFDGNGKINIKNIAIGTKTLYFDEITKNIGADDTAIRINSKTNLIEGIIEEKDDSSTYTGAYTLSGNLYNQYIESGEFFKIPIGESSLSIDNGEGTAIDTLNPVLEYNYLYF